MKNIKLFLLSLILLLSFSTGLKAEFFSDVIVTSANGIWTDSRAYSTLNAAITAVGANTRTVKIVSPQVVTTLTVPSNVTLEFDRDGSITNSGQLTIQTKNIIAPNRQIFTGAGNIDFASGTIVKTGWFNSIESAFALTVNDTVTLVVSKAQTITASYSPGNNINLKWNSPGNILTVNAGITVGNIGQVEAGNYQLFAGAGNFRFRDGTKLNLKWFPYLRSALTWIDTIKVTLEISESSPVAYSDSIPSNIQIKINKGGDLTIAGGITLTIASAKQIDIGPYYFNPFLGAGIVTITGGLTYNPATELTGAILNQLVLYPPAYEVDALYDYGGSTSFTQATITSALTAIGVVNKVTLLLRPGTWVISSNADWSAYTNVTFKIVPGAVISHGAFTVDFGGPVELAPNCLSGAGLITFADTSVPFIDPEWYVGTDTVKTQYAVNSCLANETGANTGPGSIPLRVTRQYTLTASVNIERPVDVQPDEFHIIGVGLDAGFYTAAAINMFSSATAVTDAPVVEGVTFERIKFKTASHDTANYVMDGLKFLRMKFLNCYFDGISLAKTTRYLQSWHIKNCNIRRLGNRQWLYSDATGGGVAPGQFFDVHFDGNIVEECNELAVAFIQCTNFTGSVTNNLYENSAGSFLDFTSLGAEISGNYFEGITATVPVMRLNATLGVNITGNAFADAYATTNYAVDCEAALSVTSQGNYFAGNGYKISAMAPVSHSSLTSRKQGFFSTGDYNATGSLTDVADTTYGEQIVENTLGAAATKDSVLVLSDQGQIMVMITETSSGAAQAGNKVFITRKGTGTLIETIVAAANITISCETATGYEVRFTNPTGGDITFLASILRIR